MSILGRAYLNDTTASSVKLWEHKPASYYCDNNKSQ